MTDTVETNPIDPVVAAIVDRQSTDATVINVGGRWVLRITRDLPHAVERVWPKLIEPDELRKWSPVVPDRALTWVGPATAHESPDQDAVDAEVLVSDRPRELAHRWGSHVLRWTLTPTADGCRLTLEHTFDEHAERASFAAGWHICLAALTALLDGHDAERVVGSRATDYGWQALEARYRASLIAAEMGMLIRRPVAEVYEALVDPELTTRFWFTRSTGRLEPGKSVRWDWEMYGHSADVDVDVVDEKERILMRWPAYEGDAQTTVEWKFTPGPEDTTFVTVTNTGFSGDQEAIARQAIDATGGFALVLAGMKALLEHDIELGLVRDRFPEGAEH